MIFPERRHAERSSIFRIGLFVSAFDKSLYDCLIRDLGDEGSLIEAIQHAEIGFFGRLICEQIYLDRECQVVSREGDRFELVFTDCQQGSPPQRLREPVVLQSKPV